ncbi:MAG: putative DNA binding domain-containing protein [Acidobacteria bacterium]|nr:putative DNA binding domain-containing protein [Acidobacteriota bacterium]
MFDTLDEIERQLATGEDVRAEFKEVVFTDRGVRSPNTEDMAGEMVAFANAEGGVIFLGVEDAGVVRGLPEDRMADVERWIVNVATNNCDPSLRPLIRRERLPLADGSETLVMLVEVHRGLYVHGTSGGRHYVRVGSSKQILAGAPLARLFQERGRAFVFDEQPVPTATADDLDRERLDHFFAMRPLSIPWPDLLRNTRVVSAAEGGPDRPTVAGLLAFGKAPQTHLPSAYIEAAVYRGTKLTSDDLAHSDRIGGWADVQIDDSTAFVERFMLKPARKPVGRDDYPQYDIGTIHEAIVNAVAHRDYSIAGSKIRLFLFGDRLELHSPGSLPNTLTIETMPYRVFTRNQLLVSYLSKMKSRRTGRAFLESRGEGVRRILEESERHSGRKPVYELFGQELRLTIWAKPSPHEEGADV